MSRYLFSSVQLWIGPAGTAPLTDSNAVGAVQNFSLNIGFDGSEVREAASVNLFPECRDHYASNVSADWDFVDLAGPALTMLAGFAASSEGGSAIYTLTAGSGNKPPLARVEARGKTCDGKDFTIIIPRCKADGIPFNLQRTDFASFSASVTSVPARGAGDITAQAVQIQVES